MLTCSNDLVKSVRLATPRFRGIALKVSAIYAELRPGLERRERTAHLDPKFRRRNDALLEGENSPSPAVRS
jgi:hypothetical protein